jgi:hypothetical protein
MISVMPETFPPAFMFRREIFCASFFIDWKNDAFEWFAGCKKAQLNQIEIVFSGEKIVDVPMLIRCLQIF